MGSESWIVALIPLITVWGLSPVCEPCDMVRVWVLTAEFFSRWLQLAQHRLCWRLLFSLVAVLVTRGRVVRSLGKDVYMHSTYRVPTCLARVRKFVKFLQDAARLDESESNDKFVKHYDEMTSLFLFNPFVKIDHISSTCNFAKIYNNLPSLGTCVSR